jgi:dolichyl-phosphate-mannose--protein O-mannosyl transferase
VRVDTLIPSFVVFTLGLAFEYFKEFRGASKPTTKVIISYKQKYAFFFVGYCSQFMTFGIVKIIT